VISAFLVVTLASIVVENLPQSAVRRDALRVGQPYLNAVGLDQSWALFAPEPRLRSIALRAVVAFRDGSSKTWGLPHGGALVGEYWDYHWQKWLEWVLDARHSELWRPAALFIARDSDKGNRLPVRVTLIRVTTLNNPPGAHPEQEPSVAQVYYTLPITTAMLGHGEGR
jgi:hypothetical protein